MRTITRGANGSWFTEFVYSVGQGSKALREEGEWKGVAGPLAQPRWTPQTSTSSPNAGKITTRTSWHTHWTDFPQKWEAKGNFHVVRRGIFLVCIYNNNNNRLSGTTRVSRYKKKHSPTHHPDHHPIFISFFHLLRSIASTLFKLRAWQSFCKTSPHVLFSTSWSGALHLIFHTVLHPISVLFSQHMPIPSQTVLLVCIHNKWITSFAFAIFLSSRSIWLRYCSSYFGEKQHARQLGITVHNSHS